MTSPTFGMDPLGQPEMSKDEERQMVPYHDLAPQSDLNELQYPQPRQFPLPYSHFAVLFLDHRGELQAETSSSLAGHEKEIYTNEVQHRFLKLINGAGGWSSNLHVPAPSWYHPSQPRPTGIIPCEWQSPQYKKSKTSYSREFGLSSPLWEPPSPAPSIKRTTLRVGQTKLLRSYYERAFVDFKQLSCRVIAKAFVKLVEPRKQVKYPYNGKRSVPGSTEKLKPDSEMTKPPWWPLGVKHKEPDHLKKHGRIRLLVHILCEMRDSHGVTAAKLKDASQDVRRQVEAAAYLEVLDEIFYVRGMEEMYLDGRMSGDATVQVSFGRMEEELLGQSDTGNARDHPVMTTIVHTDQQPLRTAYREIPCQQFRSRKRQASFDDFYPISPVSTSPISRKSSTERGLTSYSSDIDPAILSAPEPTRNITSSHGIQSTGPSSLPNLFAQQFATQSAAHGPHPGHWNTLAPPGVQPQFNFSGYYA